MILIFDTETSGLPTLAGGRYHLNPKKFDYYESSRIIEIEFSDISLASRDFGLIGMV